MDGREPGRRGLRSCGARLLWILDYEWLTDLYDQPPALSSPRGIKPMEVSRLRTGGYLAATLVMLCVAAMSWSGLYGWASHTLHWTPIPAGMVPVALDVAALTCALLALDTVSKNEPATMFRALTACLIGLSAFVNWRYRLASHNVAEEVFFPAMSLLAFLMIDATIRKYRGMSARAGPRARLRSR